MNKLQLLLGLKTSKSKIQTPSSKWKIFDLEGEEVLHGEVNAANTQINTTTLQPGIYDLEYANVDDLSRIRIVKN